MNEQDLELMRRILASLDRPHERQTDKQINKNEYSWENHEQNMRDIDETFYQTHGFRPNGTYERSDGTPDRLPDPFDVLDTGEEVHVVFDPPLPGERYERPRIVRGPAPAYTSDGINDLIPEDGSYFDEDTYGRVEQNGYDDAPFVDISDGVGITMDGTQPVVVMFKGKKVFEFIPGIGITDLTPKSKTKAKPEENNTTRRRKIRI